MRIFIAGLFVTCLTLSACGKEGPPQYVPAPGEDPPKNRTYPPPYGAQKS